MQQVAASPPASLETIDPRQLPVPVRRLGRNALIGMGHVWVLHRGVVIRVAAALMVMLTAVGLYQAREALVVAGHAAYNFVQGEFAAAGFGIRGIEITGQRLSSDAHIAALMAFSAGTSTITFDVQKAQARLNWLQAVESATVRKIYPDRIVVEIVEREPVLRWRIGDTSWLVDDAGAPIARDTGIYTELPLVVGAGANDDALIMINSLNRYELIKKDLAALSRIGDRRWDLIYYSGLRVQLPEQGVAQALERLESYQRDYAVLDRDVTLIDMRVPELLGFKPTVREDAKGDGKKKKP